MSMRLISLSTALVAALAGTTAFAGGKDAVIVEPVPVAPVTVAPAPVGNWTGGFAGLSFGGLNLDAPGIDDTNPVYGVHVGYDYQFGKAIIGGEAELQFGDEDFDGLDVDRVARLKLRGGYDLGQAMVYSTIGLARADTSIGDADGYFGGFGAEYKVTDSFSVGAEYLGHQFEDIGSTSIDARADTLSLRANFRF